MDEIFKNPLNFGADGLIKDSIIADFGLTCPNMCGGTSRGKCVKSNKLIIYELNSFAWQSRIEFFFKLKKTQTANKEHRVHLLVCKI
jgi:hypothetical protein